MKYHFTREQVRQVYELLPSEGLESTLQKTNLSPNVIKYIINQLQKRGIKVNSLLDEEISKIAQIIEKEVGKEVSHKEVQEIIETLYLNEDLVKALADAVLRKIKGV